MRLVRKDESIRDAPKLGVLENVLGWLANEVAPMSKPMPRCVHRRIHRRPSIEQLQVPMPQQISLSSSTGPVGSTPPVSPPPQTLLPPTHGACSPPSSLPSLISCSIPPRDQNPRCKRARSCAHAGHSDPPHNTFIASCPHSSLRPSRVKHHSSSSLSSAPPSTSRFA